MTVDKSTTFILILGMNGFRTTPYSYVPFPRIENTKIQDMGNIVVIYLVYDCGQINHLYFDIRHEWV